MQSVAIVTGGSNNIGWACARRMAVHHQGVVADIKAPEQALPPGMHFRATDVTRPEDCRALMAYAQSLGAVEALIHSAAITAPAKPVERSARILIAGIETMHMIRKGQMNCPAGSTASAADQFYSLAF